MLQLCKVGTVSEGFITIQGQYNAILTKGIFLTCKHAYPLRLTTLLLNLLLFDPLSWHYSYYFNLKKKSTIYMQNSSNGIFVDHSTKYSTMMHKGIICFPIYKKHMTFAIVHFSKIAFVKKKKKLQTKRILEKWEFIRWSFCDLIIIDQVMFVFQNFFKFECVINIFLT